MRSTQHPASPGHPPRRVVFRTDASLAIGTGHVMRCLTLADALTARGADCTFVCRPHPGHLLEQIAQRGHRALALPALSGVCGASGGLAHAHWLGTEWATDACETAALWSAHLDPQPADWLVVDHYALDARWERALRSRARRTLVIDDLADRPHEADLLLDQNLGRLASDYGAWLPAGCQCLIGPGFALLRPDFARLRPDSLARRAAASPTSVPQHLLVSLGGIDQTGMTARVLDALGALAGAAAGLADTLDITVVMGAQAPGLAGVQALADRMPRPTRVRVDVKDMAQLMAESDLAIGAAGSSAWERCALGLPTAQIVLADNQRSIAQALADAGAARTLNAGANLLQELSGWLDWAAASGHLAAMGQAAQALCDGGGTQRVILQMVQCLIQATGHD